MRASERRDGDAARHRPGRVPAAGGCSRSVRAPSRRSSSSPPPSSAPPRRWPPWWSPRPGSVRSLADIPAGHDRAPVRRAADDDRRRRLLTVLALLGCIFAPTPRGVRAVRSSSPAPAPRSGCWPGRRTSPRWCRTGCGRTAMSTLGGVFRIGLFIGPFIGARGRCTSPGCGAPTRCTSSPPWSRPACCWWSRTCRSSTTRPRRPRSPRAPVGPVVREQRSVFATLGVGVLVVSAIRAARQVVLPLWGQHLGLSPAAISVIFGISGAHRHAAVLPGRQGDGPVRPGVGGHPVDDRARRLAAAGAARPRPRPRCWWSAC